MKDTYKLKKLSIFFIVSVLIFSGGIACSEKSSKLVSRELPQPDKPTAPISISYTVPKNAAIGEAITVTVEFTTHSDVDSLKLKLTAGKGLELTSGEYGKDYGNQPMNSSFSETVTVVPQTEGILYLNVFVTGTFGDNTLVRTGAVPINMGVDVRKMLKKPGLVTTDSEGQNIIIMPAEEKKESSE